MGFDEEINIVEFKIRLLSGARWYVSKLVQPDQQGTDHGSWLETEVSDSGECLDDILMHWSVSYSWIKTATDTMTTIEQELQETVSLISKL